VIGDVDAFYCSCVDITKCIYSTGMCVALIFDVVAIIGTDANNYCIYNTSISTFVATASKIIIRPITLQQSGEITFLMLNDFWPFCPTFLQAQLRLSLQVGAYITIS